jgi:membrane-associated phospholipid phosphatase
MGSRRSVLLAVGCVLGVVGLGSVVAGGRSATGVDAAAAGLVAGWPGWSLHALVSPTEPFVLLPVLAVLAGWCLRRGRPWDAAFAVLGPSFAVSVNTWVLKPAFGRWKGDTLVYPSGHTVGLVATLVVVVVLLRRVLLAVAGGVVLAGVAAGMVGLGYHYLTDVVGGVFFGVFAALVVRGALARAEAVRPDP